MFGRFFDPISKDTYMFVVIFFFKIYSLFFYFRISVKLKYIAKKIKNYDIVNLGTYFFPRTQTHTLYLIIKPKIELFLFFFHYIENIIYLQCIISPVFIFKDRNFLVLKVFLSKRVYVRMTKFQMAFQTHRRNAQIFSQI